MQVRKAGAVAIGALAAVAAIGSPAMAYGPANQDTAAAKNLAPVGDPALIASPLGIAGPDAAGPASTAVAKAGDPFFQPLITIGTGSSVDAAAWQICGSNSVAGPGVTVASGQPVTVVGDCGNAHTQLHQGTGPGLISILDDSSVNALPWQVCGSTAVAGVGAVVAVDSPATVTGDCDNATTHITGGKDPMGPQSLISVLGGSAVNALAWQVCGSTAVMGLGVAAGVNSPTTVLGSCKDSNTTISVKEPGAIIPVLDNVVLDVLPLQVCQQDSLFSLVGLSPAINSPANVLGGCVPPSATYE